MCGEARAGPDPDYSKENLENDQVYLLDDAVDAVGIAVWPPMPLLALSKARQPQPLKILRSQYRFYVPPGYKVPPIQKIYF